MRVILVHLSRKLVKYKGTHFACKVTKTKCFLKWSVVGFFSPAGLCSTSYLICSFCFPLQMGFIQINEDFIFIEPLNHTLTVTGHAHRVYRRKRSIEEKISEKTPSQNPYCGVVTGNIKITLKRCNVANTF